MVTIAPRFIPAAEVNLFFLLETIIGPIWVWLIYGENISLGTLFGGSLIFASIFGFAFFENNKRKIVKN